MIPTAATLKDAPTAEDLEKRRIWRIAAAKAREKKRKILENDPVEKEKVNGGGSPWTKKKGRDEKRS